MTNESKRRTPETTSKPAPPTLARVMKGPLAGYTIGVTADRRADEQMKLRVDGKDSGTLGLAELAARVTAVQAGNANTPVVISADRNVKYETVVKAMDVLQRAGVQRVGLSVKQSAPS